MLPLTEPLPKRARIFPPSCERIMIYVKQETEDAFTALHVKPPTAQGLIQFSIVLYAYSTMRKLFTLRSLLDQRSMLGEQGNIFLEDQLSEQAELSKQGGIFLQRS